jgi:phosphoadenosine phosphosulfate reductase
MTSLSAVRVRPAPAVEPAPRPALREVAQHETIVAQDDASALPLWRNGRFEADEWTLAAEDEAVAEGPAILPLERYLAEREALTARNAPLGVLVRPNEAIEELAPHLDRVALVALQFPKFADGRSMSIARLLRERYGFTGEIRATGDVLIDQMPLMRRCGFDAFEVTNGPTRAQLAAGKWPDMPNYLQPVGSSAQAEIPAGTRPWARKPG